MRLYACFVAANEAQGRCGLGSDEEVEKDLDFLGEGFLVLGREARAIS